MYDYLFVDQDGKTVVPFWWQFHPTQIMDYYDFYDADTLTSAIEEEPQMRAEIGTALINTILYHIDHNSDLLSMNKDERRLFNNLKQYSDKSWSDLEKFKASGAKGGKAKAKNRETDSDT